MAESKFLEGDKDEWFYQSLERYKNLYMFELEFPVDAIEVINEINFCISGIQNYSKKCEILQLSIPPKLLPKDVEEGLCKDRDFNIISGGYASARILQIKPIAVVENLVATTQVGVNGVTLFQLGDDEHALVKEKCTLDLPEALGAGVIDNTGNRLVATGTKGHNLYEWILDSASGNFGMMSHKIQNNQGPATKVKYWDETTLSVTTEKGTVALYDTRSDTTTMEFSARKAADQLPGIQYSHDTIPGKNRIGIVDSCGGYESFDIRKGMSTDSSRVILPGCTDSDGLIARKFNLQYDPHIESGSTSNFIVTGMKEDVVQIYQEIGNEVSPLFRHDGHSKVVTHALWHPTSERLLLSCSIDAVLHAWQYHVVKEPIELSPGVGAERMDDDSEEKTGVHCSTYSDSL